MHIYFSVNVCDHIYFSLGKNKICKKNKYLSKTFSTVTAKFSSNQILKHFPLIHANPDWLIISMTLMMLVTEETPPRAPPRTRISHDEYHQFCDETLECMTACLLAWCLAFNVSTFSVTSLNVDTLFTSLVILK